MVPGLVESNYDILGIEEGSTQKDIRNAFRRLALQAHSDWPCRRTRIGVGRVPSS